MDGKQENEKRIDEQIPDTGAAPESSSYSFIEEEVIPKRGKKWKKFLNGLFLSILMAIIFGLVASIVLFAGGSYFQKRQEEQEAKREEVSIVQPEPAPEQVTEPETETPEEEPETPSYNPQEQANIYQEVARGGNRSLVTVTGVESGVDWFLNESEKTSSTSGLIYGDNKVELLILVNRSKVIDATEIRVTFSDGVTTTGTLQDSDETTGLAVVAVPLNNLKSSTKESYELAVFGDVYELEPGDPVLALGNPNGYQGGLIQCNITNYPNEQYVVDGMVELLHTDMTDNANGDGVILNLQGQVVGIITHEFKTNLNASISTVLAMTGRLKTLLQDMANQKKRAYCGIYGAELTEEVANTLGTGLGIYITEVESESPAYEAGLQTGDVITAIDGNAITGFSAYEASLRQTGTKGTISVKITRTTRTTDRDLTINVTLKGKK